MTLSPELEDHREELAQHIHEPNACCGRGEVYREGFDACYAAMKERERIAVEALEFYARHENFHYCGDDSGEPENAEPEHPNWLSGEGAFDVEDGAIARYALARLREPFNKERT